MIFTVKQTFPRERILFESNLKAEAVNVLDTLIMMGNGWFELWHEGYDVPIQAGGEQAFSPFTPTRWDVLDMASAVRSSLDPQPSTPPVQFLIMTEERSTIH